METMSGILELMNEMTRSFLNAGLVFNQCSLIMEFSQESSEEVTISWVPIQDKESELIPEALEIKKVKQIDSLLSEIFRREEIYLRKYFLILTFSDRNFELLLRSLSRKHTNMIRKSYSSKTRSWMIQLNREHRLRKTQA